MALIVRGMYKLILRVDVRQEIDPYAWKYLLRDCMGRTNWDGEIFLFSAMNPMDMSMISGELMRFGFRWSKDLQDADFAWFDFTLPKLHWLEEVSAKPLKKKLQPVELWQMKGSSVDWFATFDGRIRTRGEDYEW